MALSGYYDAAGNWHDPGEEAQQAGPPASRPSYPSAPAPAPTPTEETAPPVVAPPGPTPTPPPGTTWNPPSYTGPMRPDTSWLTGAPAFNAPVFQAPPAFAYDAWKQPDPFKAPSFEDVLNDPGYVGRRDEGAQAVRQAASSMGKLRTGGTIKDLLNYNQQFASREYGNVYDRSANTYKTNYDNLWNAYQGNYNTAADVYKTNYGVSRDVFDRGYQGAKDMYQPQLLTWQNQQQAQQRAAEQEYNRQYDLFKYQNPSADTIFNAGAPR